MKIISKLRKLVFAILFFLCVIGVSQAQVFSDVDENHENAEAIDYLSKEGIINGYEDGSFQPLREVNRAEALKILLLANNVGVVDADEDVFSDVKRDEWFTPFVKVAKDRGIVSGYSDGSFLPAQTVNLVEALKMLLQSGEVDLTNYSISTQLFNDTQTNAWYNPYLFYAMKFELVDANSQNQVFPSTPLTRGKLAEIVYRFKNRVDFICPKFFENTKTYKADYFQKITLNRELPNVFYENEVYLIDGILDEDDSNEEVTAYYTDSRKQQEAFYGDVENKNFAIPVTFTTPDVYSFSILPGVEGKSYALNIEVLPRECNPSIIHASATPPQNLQTSLEENTPYIRWENRENNLVRVVIRQNEKRFERLLSANQNSLQLNPKDFENWEEGEASLQIFGSKSENGFTFEPHTNWVLGGVTNLTIAQHHYSRIAEDELEVKSTLPDFRVSGFNFMGVAKTALSSTAYLINPDGSVSDIEINSNDTISPNTTFNFALSLPQVDTYILEINNSQGLAVLNYPIYKPNTFPLIPDFYDLRGYQDNQRVSVNREKAIWLRLINDFRATHQLHAVKLDDDLSKFAQTYAEEMAEKDFFGHTDLDGKDPDARRREAGLYLPVGENLARDYTTEYAHEGLLRSAAHRANILTPDWSRVGLGIAKNSRGELVFVQEFSTALLEEANLESFREELLTLLNAKREEANLLTFTLDSTLLEVSQNWSEKMLNENFFAFEGGGVKLENEVKNAIPNTSFSLFISSASKLPRLVESIENETSFNDSNKTRIAIGLTQNDEGSLLATFILR